MIEVMIHLRFVHASACFGSISTASLYLTTALAKSPSCRKLFPVRNASCAGFEGFESPESADFFIVLNFGRAFTLFPNRMQQMTSKSRRLDLVLLEEPRSMHSIGCCFPQTKGKIHQLAAFLCTPFGLFSSQREQDTPTSLK